MTERKGYFPDKRFFARFSLRHMDFKNITQIAMSCLSNQRSNHTCLLPNLERLTVGARGSPRCSPRLSQGLGRPPAHCPASSLSSAPRCLCPQHTPFTDFLGLAQTVSVKCTRYITVLNPALPPGFVRILAIRQSYFLQEAFPSP